MQTSSKILMMPLSIMVVARLISPACSAPARVSQLTVMPVQVGTVWLFKDTLRSEQEKPGKIESSGKLRKMTITASQANKHGAVILIHQTYSNVYGPKVATKSQENASDYVMYEVLDNVKLYNVSEDTDAVTLDKYKRLSATVKSGARLPAPDESKMLVDFSSKTDYQWKSDPDASAAANYYWCVAGVKTLPPNSVVAGFRLKSTAVEYTTEYRTNPDDTERVFVSGIGLIGSHYHHHGTVMDTDNILLKFIPATNQRL